MNIGTELIIKNNIYNLQKGNKVLYLRHCLDSDYSCFEVVIMDSNYDLLLKHFNVNSLEKAYKSFIEDSVIPMDIEQFSFKFTTLKIQAKDLCLLEDLLKEQSRLTERLQYINKLIESI